MQGKEEGRKERTGVGRVAGTYYTLTLALIAPPDKCSAKKRLVSSCMLSGLYSPPPHAACIQSATVHSGNNTQKELTENQRDKERE